MSVFGRLFIVWMAGCSLLFGCSTGSGDGKALPDVAEVGGSPDAGLDVGTVDEVRAPDGAATDGQDAAGPDEVEAPAGRIAEMEFGDFQAWAEPIADYIAVGEGTPNAAKFNRAITDLRLFEGRLWFGYGDATYNMGGNTPIEFRYFESSEEPTALSAMVNGEGQGAPQATPEATGEEQIDHYRVCDGVLWQAGIDSTDADELWTQAKAEPKPIEGNVYALDGTAWNKYRTIPGGEHVHDVISWKGDLYAVGSGADIRPEFEAGQIFRYLWRSTDHQTFETVQRIQHPEPGKGDTRFVHLLPAGDTLYLFGYQSDWAAEMTYIQNAIYTGGTEVADIPKSNLLYGLFPFGTVPLPDGSGLVYGVDIGLGDPVLSLVHVLADGSPVRLDDFGTYSVVDIDVREDTGEILYLAYEGNAYGVQLPEYAMHVFVADVAAPAQTVDLMQYTSAQPAGQIAYWDEALFLGTVDGQVLKAPRTN